MQANKRVPVSMCVRVCVCFHVYLLTSYRTQSQLVSQHLHVCVHMSQLIYAVVSDFS